MLPETNLSEAKIVADRILAKFTHDSLTIDDKEILTITLSIGLTEYMRNEGIEMFLHRADVIMYEAKKSEGNSVVLAPDSKELSVTNMPQLSWSC